MNNLIIKTEYLPSRCEICHQKDYFNADYNHCERCKEVYKLKQLSIKEQKPFLIKSIIIAVWETILCGSLGFYLGWFVSFLSILIIEDYIPSFRYGRAEHLGLILMAIHYVIGLVALEGNIKQIIKAAKPVIIFLIIGVLIGKMYSLLSAEEKFPFVTDKVVYCALLLPGVCRVFTLTRKFQQYLPINKHL